MQHVQRAGAAGLNDDGNLGDVALGHCLCSSRQLKLGMVLSKLLISIGVDRS